MNINQNNNYIDQAIQLAFEAGKWVGQVELEEYFDREQYSKSVMESLISRKTSMPLYSHSTGKTVIINLRSDKWRRGVVESANQYIEIAKKMLKSF